MLILLKDVYYYGCSYFKCGHFIYYKFLKKGFFILKVNIFKESLLELKSIKNLSLIAFFLGFLIVVNFLTIEVSGFCSISFGFIVICLVGWMFGPFVGAMFGFFGDILSYMIHPVGDFFILYAVSVMVDGILYGLFLYKNKFNGYKIVLTQIVRDILVNFLLNTYFISIQYNCSFLKLLLTVRIIKNIIKMPINCFLIFFITKFVKKILKKKL